MHNDRVPAPNHRPVRVLVALAATAAVALAGCSSDAGGSTSGSTASSSAPASPSPSPSSTVNVPDGVQLTDEGSKLSFGRTATVIFEPTQNRGSVLQLTVQSVQQGTLADFKGFILDDAYKQKADYYYAKVQVRNVGAGDVGGVPVPLWGVNAANTLLPAVNFTTTFPKCPSKPLPARFAAGAVLNTCLVYLSPNKGSLRAVSYRPSQEFNPVTWSGPIAKPIAKPTDKPTDKPSAKPTAKPTPKKR
jgi:hypothetical protein